ncbi:MAG TPA: DUF4231 domain-containing protein [Candidatus Binatia bacterium]|nr:DUF4231 domain-containing protein [Candidatus Binatia bacterium]
MIARLDPQIPYDHLRVRLTPLDRLRHMCNCGLPHESITHPVNFEYYRLRLVAIIGGVIVPALVGLNFTSPTDEIVRGVIFFLGLAVAISVAVEELFHYGERWRHYRSMVEVLKSEGWQLFQLSGRYEHQASHEAAYREFADRVEQILSADVSKFITEVVREKSHTDIDAKIRKGEQANNA